jgi:hypothetical protein
MVWLIEQLEKRVLWRLAMYLLTSGFGFVLGWQGTWLIWTHLPQVLTIQIIRVLVL